MVEASQKGFTLIEIMLVVTIIAILAAIAYPNYQKYVIRTKRVDMMKDMRDIGQQIENQKLIQKNYRNIDKSSFEGDYPKSSSNKLYTVSINGIGSGNSTTNISNGKWEIVATPKSTGQMKDDGVLKLHYDAKKCRGTTCGMGDEWRDE